MLTTNDEKLAKRMQWLKAQAFGRQSHFWHEDFGYNFRMSAMQAALGLSQLNRIQELVAARRVRAQIYMKNLRDVDGLALPVQHDGCVNVYWMFSVVLPDDVNRDEIIKTLDERYNIETRPMFHPLHLQPIYQYLGYEEGDFPVSEWLGRQGINLPSSASLTPAEIEYVADALKEAIDGGE